MSLEDLKKALETLGNVTINVAGDFVQEKNQTFNYSIEKVEAGGIGMQFLTGEETPEGITVEASHSKRGRPKHSGKKIAQSFLYDAGSETNTRLQYLYNGLKALGWIKPDTDLRTFLGLFSGKETKSRVVWTGETNTLAELFRELVIRKQIVQLPKGESLWVMVNARFWNKEGNLEFGNERLCDTRTPIEMKDKIALLVNIMNPDYPVEEVKKALQSQE